MKYALLLYDDPANGAEIGTPEMDAELQQWFAFTEELSNSGKNLGGEALNPVETATTVRIRDGRTVTVDGPFAETKDLIAGWMIIDVEGRDRAVELAGELSAAPGAGGRPLGEWLEVRPFLDDRPNAVE